MFSRLWRSHHATTDGFEDLCLTKVRNEQTKNEAFRFGLGRCISPGTDATNDQAFLLELLDRLHDRHPAYLELPGKFGLTGQASSAAILTRGEILLKTPD